MLAMTFNFPPPNSLFALALTCDSSEATGPPHPTMPQKGAFRRQTLGQGLACPHRSPWATRSAQLLLTSVVDTYYLQARTCTLGIEIGSSSHS